MSKRKHERCFKRLETVFSAAGVTFRGRTSDISERGLFIRARRSFIPDTILDIELELPDGSVSKFKGKVCHAISTGLSHIRNGMGIEILEKDNTYDSFVRDCLHPS